MNSANLLFNRFQSLLLRVKWIIVVKYSEGNLTPTELLIFSSQFSKNQETILNNLRRNFQ